VIRHNVCPGGKTSHTGGVGGDVIYALCLETILEREGEEAVRGYLQYMKEITNSAGNLALLRFEEYIADKNKGDEGKWLTGKRITKFTKNSG